MVTSSLADKMFLLLACNTPEQPSYVASLEGPTNLADCETLEDPDERGDCTIFAVRMMGHSPQAAEACRELDAEWKPVCIMEHSERLPPEDALEICWEAEHLKERCVAHLLARQFRDQREGLEDPAALLEWTQDLVKTSGYPSVKNARPDLAEQFVGDLVARRLIGQDITEDSCGNLPDHACVVAIERSFHIARAHEACHTGLDRFSMYPGIPSWDPAMEEIVAAAHQRFCDNNSPKKRRG